MDKKDRRIDGGRAHYRGGQAEPRAGAAPLWGCAARLVQLNPPVKGARTLLVLSFLLPLL